MPMRLIKTISVSWLFHLSSGNCPAAEYVTANCPTAKNVTTNCLSAGLNFLYGRLQRANAYWETCCWHPMEMGTTVIKFLPDWQSGEYLIQDI